MSITALLLVAVVAPLLRFYWRKLATSNFWTENTVDNAAGREVECYDTPRRSSRLEIDNITDDADPLTRTTLRTLAWLILPPMSCLLPLEAAAERNGIVNIVARLSILLPHVEK
ncbi:MAG: hypothetical protein H6643_02975 [Caldilineaceae bacterium]|nr:hypothetical protein [Caldilineaceae bacterium]